MGDFFAYAARGTRTLYRRKPFIPNSAYHVFNRRDDCTRIFRDDVDRQRFIDSMVRLWRRSLDPTIKPRAADGVRLLAFAVLDNHFHLVLEQFNEDAMTDYMRGLMTSYVRKHNARHQTSGSLFDERYQARPIESRAHLLRVIAYVHANPPNPHTSRWSSHAAFVHGERDNIGAVDWRHALGYYGSRDGYLSSFAEQVEKRERKRLAL